MPCCALHFIANNLLLALSPGENPLSSLKIRRSFSDQSSHLPSCRLNLGKLTMPFRLVSWEPPEVARLERLAEYAVGCAAGKAAIFQICGRDGLEASSYFVLEKCGGAAWRIAYHGGPQGAYENPGTYVPLRNGSRAWHPELQGAC